MRSVLVRSDRGLNEYAFDAIRCDLADEVHQPLLFSPLSGKLALMMVLNLQE
jgi:hypothetical protein